MKLETAIERSLKIYGGLYNSTDPRVNRLTVLSDLYLMIGNGFEWTADGYLCPDDRKAKPYGAVWRLTKEEVADSKRKVKRRKDVLFEPYPICEYACLVTIPDNVQDDWLAGAFEIIDAVERYYNDPAQYAFCDEYPSAKRVRREEIERGIVVVKDQTEEELLAEIEGRLNGSISPEPYIPNPTVVKELMFTFEKHRSEQLEWCRTTRIRCDAILIRIDSKRNQ